MKKLSLQKWCSVFACVLLLAGLLTACGAPAQPEERSAPPVRQPEQEIVRGTLETIAQRASHIRKTALVLVGGFLGDEYERSRLYDPSFSHGCREADA